MSAPMSAGPVGTIQVSVEVIGVSRVVKAWGTTMSQIDQGTTLLLTKNSADNIDGILNPSAVFVPPDLYNALESQPGMAPHRLERCAASTLRSSWAENVRETVHSETLNMPRHVVVAHKMQERYERKFRNPKGGGFVILPQPASNGTDRAYLVGIRWFARAIGMDVDVLRSQQRLRACGLLA